MARLGRYFLPDQPLHLIQRGIDRQAVFFKPDDYARYRDWLIEAADEYGCAIHAYVLMTNHAHLLVTPSTTESLPRTMQSLGRRYVRYINGTHKRTGTMWEGRYRAAPIDSDAYFLACCRYIELNPVRARKAAHPRDYQWSSFRAHADGQKDRLVSDHRLYRALGRSAADRQQSYREMFRAKLSTAFVEALRAATNGGWALGDERFKRQIAKKAGRRADKLPTGRPPAKRTGKRQINLL